MKEREGATTVLLERQVSNTGEHGEVHGLYSAGWEEEEGKMGINGRSFFGVWPLGQNTRCDDVRSFMALDGVCVTI